MRDNAVASATWFWCTKDTDPGPQVATSILCRDVVEARTRLVLGRDMISISWRGQPLGCRDMALGVTTRRLQGDLKLVPRHGLACLGSRHEFCVATRPVHGKGTGVALVSLPARKVCAPSASSIVRRQRQRARPRHGC